MTSVLIVVFGDNALGMGYDQTGPACLMSLHKLQEVLHIDVSRLIIGMHYGYSNTMLRLPLEASTHSLSAIRAHDLLAMP